MLRIKAIFRVATTPSCWIRNHPTSAVLSAHINAELDAGHTPVIVNEHWAVLSGLKLWIANYPYAYGYIANGPKAMPDRATVFRLHDAVMKALCEGTLEEGVRRAIEAASGKLSP